MTDQGTQNSAQSALPATLHADMQAVVVIHGMGEQRPMDTIKGFVKAVWETDSVICANGLPHPSQVWSKPDPRTGSLELRRVTTRESIPSVSFPGGVRTDFYELYWADLTAGSTWEEFTAWVGGLLLRRPKRVPRDVRSAWVALWIATLCVLAIGGLSVLPADFWQSIGVGWLANWHWLLALVAAGLGTWLHRKATATFGRVVRYTKADPDNIAARQNVRERGLKLLSSIHDSNYYKRIVIVSHSLGTILAYDLLSYFWAQHEAARKLADSAPEFDALCELEKAAAAVEQPNKAPAALDAYYEAQRQLRISLASRTFPSDPPSANPAFSRWLISDFVTLGSPLAHSEFLIAADDRDLAQRKLERELPQSPPMREDLDPKTFDLAKATQKLPVGASFDVSKLVSFPLPASPKIWELHHAAPFAVVRWTNIYDPAWLVYRGDVIGGPLARKFGPAVIDVNLKSLRGQATSFTHTKYWEIDGEPIHIEALRWAINLLDEVHSSEFVSNGAR
jgi:hypothetical protein